MKKTREDKVLEAQKRAVVRNALTPQQQLARLDERLGAGMGAAKERERLMKEI